jgi:hypothetical protein
MTGPRPPHIRPRARAYDGRACWACYRPLSVGEAREGHYCGRCEASGAADRHRLARTIEADA